MIYFVQHVGLSVIKIGWTTNLGKRLVMLRAECGSAVRVLAVMSGGRFDEGALHDHLRACRAWSEWFWPMEPVVEFMQRNANREAPEGSCLRYDRYRTREPNRDHL